MPERDAISPRMVENQAAPRKSELSMNSTKTWLAHARLFVLSAIAIFHCTACSSEKYQSSDVEITLAAAALPEFSQTPTVVRVSATSNEISWTMEPGKTYALHWSLS